MTLVADLVFVRLLNEYTNRGRDILPINSFLVMELSIRHADAGLRKMQASRQNRIIWEE